MEFGEFHGEKMSKYLAFFTALIVALTIGKSAVFAKDRIALVIGNSAYESIAALSNPKNDALLITESLKKSGFEVITVTDVDIRGMGRAILKFGKSLRSAGKDAVGLFYYAGHGVQSNGVNYLLPLAAEIEAEADLDIEAINTSQILRQMELAGNALNLIILDACRNNPLIKSTGGIEGGLARITTSSGSLVAFSAAPGKVALDGVGVNSPYTQALSVEMLKPGLSIEKIFKNVRVSVEKQTDNKQTPWEESSLKDDFFFTKAIVEKPKAILALVEKQQDNAPATDKQPPSSQDMIELEYWQSAKEANSLEFIQSYLTEYPKGRFVLFAKQLIKKLEGDNPAKPAPLPSLNASVAPQKKIDECDRYASSPSDPQKASEGVSFSNLDTNLAMPACQRAHQSFPNNHRFTFLLARTLNKNKKMAEAVKLYKLAAHNGYGQAMSNLGLMYKKGYGVKRSYLTAVYWYEKAARIDNPSALHNYAILYDRGLGVGQNSEKAAIYVYSAIQAKLAYSSEQVINNPKFWSSVFWRKFQNLLFDDKYYIGKVDGVFRDDVRASIILLAEDSLSR